MEKRLQSLKLPRDLTLGGSKPKKRFAPNLNVARSKDKKESFYKTEEKPKIKNLKQDGRNTRKNHTKTERFMQSSGIFADGMGSENVNKVAVERHYHHVKHDVSNGITFPKVKKDKVELKKESKLLEEIVGCGSSSDDDEKFLCPIAWNGNNLKDTKVKQKLNPDPYQNSGHFTDYNPALLLWKLPDSFGGKNLRDENNLEGFLDYKLNDMLEGQIGKLRILKSGRIEVTIGNIKYNLESSYLESITEKVVCINTESQEPSSVVLGEIHSHYTVSPNWSDLLE
ncbi:hypothetical protein ABEB36_011236 [Hypothenemus hampei]|uniref:DNA-directed RNA polymerase III subunit RPC4 n=1 Tax=Hypothenemus hampei TaxID=57062 RepID=A0ABD1EEP6_HYPHA